MKEIYETSASSYEDAKLRAILAVLSLHGIEVKEDKDATRVYKDGELVATLEISI